MGLEVIQLRGSLAELELRNSRELKGQTVGPRRRNGNALEGSDGDLIERRPREATPRKRRLNDVPSARSFNSASFEVLINDQFSRVIPTQRRREGVSAKNYPIGFVPSRGSFRRGKDREEQEKRNRNNQS